MKEVKNKLALRAAILAGSVVGAFKGEIAKLRFIVKMKNKFDIHDRIRQHQILLDEFELSAFHTS